MKRKPKTIEGSLVKEHLNDAPTIKEYQDSKAHESSPCTPDLDEADEDEEAECVPNGAKIIECFICNVRMTKIYLLREHMQLHADACGYDLKNLKSSPIYSQLNPQHTNIDSNIIRDFLVQEVKENRISQFYGILNEAQHELHISDSETDTDTECEKAQIGLIPQNKYKCELCQIKFDRRYKTLFHQRTNHSFQKLHIECDYCGQRFCSIQLLIHHLKTQCESDEHPINCVERFRQYLLKVNLEQFQGLAQARKELKIQRLTTAEKVYACGVCQKTFLRSEHLTRHKAVHMPDELKMECPVCFKKFNRKDNLRTHMKVHMDEAERDACDQNQAILCQYCGHCFTSKSNYVVHMRRHTGEKPYSCDVCGKGFPKSSELNLHKVTHSDERKYMCSVCKRTFTRSSILKKHMRTHMGPFHCTYCDESFRRPNELANHLRLHAKMMKKTEKKLIEPEEKKYFSELHYSDNESFNLPKESSAVSSFQAPSATQSALITPIAERNINLLFGNEEDSIAEQESAVLCTEKAELHQQNLDFSEW